MISLEDSVLQATVTGTTVAGVGTYFGIDPFYILVGVAICGSLASVGIRWMNGYLKDWKSRLMAFVLGILMSVVAIPWLNSHGLEGLDSAIFVLFISLIGARVIRYIATDFDIETVVDWFTSRFKK